MTDLRTPPVSDGDLFSQRARQYAQEKPLQRIHILEAGCGWGTGLDLGDREHHVTGVDIDSPDLRAHTAARPDLDAWHLGDLRTVPLPPRAFDIVHASFLIERVPHAELVLDRFVAALKPGGLLLVRLRDRNTAFGFLDRTVPNWMHVGGRTGLPPAIYDRVASRSGMQWYCVMRGLVIAEEYTSRQAIKALGAGTGLAELLCRLVSMIGRGRLPADHSEVTLVIRKPENRFARVI
ncbi:class I SAM-dependent methyltransferase [Actinomadura sp. KC216]|uniref:class I SAM-dependent methyltransferase n=1 Tax=Actinomadura sp. KC216 TaxID=2530370 RepID=UPI0010439BAA|nr:class I SAM-dependent methyltransferase [Actinomadura sp. KC216]TDB89590.1 class I SAM-dependent methyltransferase [Actinomadura sp. KC216]